MSTIILDFGSGNSCRNDKQIVKRMYNELKAVDTGKHTVVAKWQLFKEAGQNIPLDRDVFDFAYKYGRELGYQVTSSVFDKESLDFLLQYEIPFVKIANRRDLDWLAQEVPRRIPVVISHGSPDELKACRRFENEERLLCVSEYPTTMERYEGTFNALGLMIKCDGFGISDHTTNFGLWYRYQPEIIEWHYMLPDSTGLDAGPFARTPAMLAEVL